MVPMMQERERVGLRRPVSHLCFCWFVRLQTRQKHLNLIVYLGACRIVQSSQTMYQVLSSRSDNQELYRYLGY